jgi:hypothetical protein
MVRYFNAFLQEGNFKKIDAVTKGASSVNRKM